MSYVDLIEKLDKAIKHKRRVKLAKGGLFYSALCSVVL